MEKEKEKEVLNIVIADGSDSLQYVEYLNLHYNVNVVKAANVKRTSEIDLVLFTGGADVDPAYYNESVGKYTGINKDRDAKEIAIFDQFNSRPKLGICRGSQLLTVLSKGKLIQHVEGHTQDHTIEIPGWGEYFIPSTHHQMMYPYTLPKDDYELKAWSSKFLSDTYLNGKDEEVKLPSDFYEPEIVEYFRTKSLCIQGHPEFGNNEIKTVTLAIIDQFLKKFKSKKLGLYDLDSHDYEEKTTIEEPKKHPSWMNVPPSFGNSIGIKSRNGSITYKSVISDSNDHDWTVTAGEPIRRDLNASKPMRGISEQINSNPFAESAKEILKHYEALSMKQMFRDNQSFGSTLNTGIEPLTPNDVLEDLKS